MIYEPKISLVIVSRNRPAGLRRLVSALRFQTYKNYEIIVVTNSKEIMQDQIKLVFFDEANISAARNLGMQVSAGELIAFCDDDAIPEPTWLECLVAPFCDPNVGMAGGFVRGRNGIDYQWKAQQVNQFGFDRALAIDAETSVETFVVKDGWCPKVQGTNSMFRKTLLYALGGFDEGFTFYLDETDVCWRASQKGWATAFVPNAQVQHGFEESDRRTSARVPLSLFSEGFSKAYFCQKHGNGENCSDVYKAFQTAQRKRLVKLMVSGRLMSTDVEKLLETLRAGLTKGQNAKAKKPVKLMDKNTTAFKPQMVVATQGKVFAGSIFSRNEMIETALDSAQKGVIVTVFCWSLTLLFHRRYFDERGFWLQTGGLFGKSERNKRYFHCISLKTRSLKEAEKLKRLRKIKEITIFRFKKGRTVVK